MKEAINSPYPNLVFRETFNDTQSFINNNGYLSDVNITNGTVINNTASSFVSYTKRKWFSFGNGVIEYPFSIRTKVYIPTLVADYYDIVLYGGGSNNEMVMFLAYQKSTNKLIAKLCSNEDINTYISAYIEIPLSEIENKWHTFVVTYDASKLANNISIYQNGIKLNTTTGTSGNYIAMKDTESYTYLYLNYRQANAKIDLFELYNTVLTESEVANLYNDSWNKELTGNTLIDFDATNGVLEDSTVGNTVGDAIIDNDYDFTSGWNLSNATVINSNSFSTTQTGGVWKQTGVLVVGKKYRINIQGSTTASFIAIGSESGTGMEYGVWFGIHEFIAENDGLWIRNQGAGVTIISQLVVQEIRPELDITNVEVVRDGRFAGKWNGIDSMIDTGTTFNGLTGAITIMGWIKPYSLGEGGYGRILNNGSFIFSVYTNNSILCSSDGGIGGGISANNSISLNKWNFVAVTRETDGTVNFYIGDKNTAPTLNGSADKASGTPAAGASNALIGNNASQTRTFDGLIPKLKVIEGILSLTTITQYWSETLKEV